MIRAGVKSEAKKEVAGGLPTRRARKLAGRPVYEGESQRARRPGWRDGAKGCESTNTALTPATGPTRIRKHDEAAFLDSRKTVFATGPLGVCRCLSEKKGDEIWGFVFFLGWSDDLVGDGEPVVVDNAKQDSTLLDAGLVHARTVVATNNVETALLVTKKAREKNAKAHIIVRCYIDDFAEILETLGANEVISRSKSAFEGIAPRLGAK